MKKIKRGRKPGKVPVKKLKLGKEAGVCGNCIVCTSGGIVSR
jgi:hypothetical protein